jgi:hypothetical protein
MTLLADALRAETLDASLAPIQKALGIRFGDTAAAVFSGLPRGDDDWPELSLEERSRWLIEWLSVELIDAVQEVMDNPSPHLVP